MLPRLRNWLAGTRHSRRSPNAGNTDHILATTQDLVEA